MSKLPPQDFTREIAALEREVLKQQPADILQFCSNFFHRRLESQRAEFHLQQRHSSAGGGGMAESTFPGSNPFGGSSNSSGGGGGGGSGASSSAPAVGGGGSGPRGMHSVAEEEEHDFQSPTASSFPPGVREAAVGSPASTSNVGDMADNNNNNNTNTTTNGGFGNFGFGAASTNTGASRNINKNNNNNNNNPPSQFSTAAMDSPQSFPTNYNMNRRTSVSAESLAPAAADDNNWKAPSYPKTSEQYNRLRAAVSHNFLFSHLDDEQTAL
ncbi:hypothetical protein B0A55_12425, partial [Friedmanniomyces simplex]